MIYQLPPPKSPDSFESIICDLLNALYNTTSFTLYGRKGQKQNGIDIVSSEKKIVAQCKLRNLNLNNKSAKIDFINEIIKDINSILFLDNPPSKIIIATSIENDTLIHDQLNTIMIKNNSTVLIEFWSWDYISNHLFLFSFLVNRYYPYRNNLIELAKIEVHNKNVYRKDPSNERLYIFHDSPDDNILPVFDISFINNSENTILLNSIDIIAKILPVGLAGVYPKPTGLLKVTTKINTEIDFGDLYNEGKTIIELADSLYVYPKTPFRIQIQNLKPIVSFVKIKLAFHFSSGTIVTPDIFFNSERGVGGRIVGLR